MTAAEKRIITFFTRHGLAYEWQALAYDGRRAVVATLDWPHHMATLEAARRLKGIRINDWTCDLGGVFEGYVYFQDETDANRIDAITTAKMQRHDNWWNVYHNCIVDGLDPIAAAQRAEALFPTPATL